MMDYALKERETISLVEAAELLKVSWGTARNLFHAGSLDGYKLTEGISSPIRIYRDSVIAYAKRQQNRIIK